MGTTLTAAPRCGVTSLGGRWGCCRPLGHVGDHCAHDADTLTGTAGRIVVGRNRRFGATLGACDGTAHPAGDRHVWSHRPGAIENRFELIPPTEGETP